MKITQRILVAGVSLLLVLGGLLGYVVGRARASGPPAAKALTYSGVLTDTAGTPLVGSKNIQIQIWDDATAGDIRCIAGPASQTLVAGGFSVTLPEACTAAVHASSDLWAEVFVDATSLGRAKLGAVPYALQAAQASDATGALRTTLTVLDSATVKISGDQSIAGRKNFTGSVTLACPMDMIDSGAGFCIDAVDRQETAYASSVGTCATEGKVLCAFRELCTAKTRNIGGIAGAYRIADLMLYTGDFAHYLGGGNGGNGLSMPPACATLTPPGPHDGSLVFRCCRSKG